MNMNPTLRLLLFMMLFLPFTGRCQLAESDKAIVDIGKQTNLQKLHQMLIAGRPGQLEQLRAFYVWTGHYISYNIPASKAPRPEPAKQEPGAVLRSGKAICHGYSRLFQELCRLSGIPCMLINGYARPSPESGLYGHTWNGVYVNGEWQLVDATWGAGGIADNGKFVKDFTEEYFLPKASAFMQTHYPFDPAWQLTSQPLTLKMWKKGNATDTAEKGAAAFNFRDTLQQFLSNSDSITTRLASTTRMVTLNPDDKLSKQEHAVALLAKANFHQLKGNTAILQSNKQHGNRSASSDRKTVLQEAMVNYRIALEYYKQINDYDSSFRNITGQSISSATNNIAYIEQELKR